MSKGSRRRWLVVTAASVALFGLGVTAAGAGPTPVPANSGSPPIDPAAVPAAVSAHRLPVPAKLGRQCGLAPSAHHGVGSGRGCLRVSATMPAAPAVGATARLRFDVQAELARPGTEITVELPANLRFDGTPAGMTVAEHTSRAPADGGRVRTATTYRTLKAGSRTSFDVPVVAVATGTAEIRVRATAAKPDTDVGYDSVFLTIGGSGAVSKLGIDASAGAPVSGPVGADGMGLPFRDDKLSGIHPNATACVTGSFRYSGTDGSSHPARFWGVEAWDSDTFSDDDRLAVGLTDGNGNYFLCFDNSDEFGTQDVSMRFLAFNPWWSLARNVNQPAYVYSTAERSNIPDGTTTMPAPTVPIAEMLGVQAFDEIAAAWQFAGPGEHCWNGQPGRSCKRIAAHWNPTANWNGNQCTQASDCYQSGSDRLFLSANSPRFRNVVAHEAGHAIMDDSYHDNFPAATNCIPHSISLASSDTCAWTEGFADWVGVAAFDDTHYVGGPGFDVDLENATWGSPMDNGDTVEGRVAGALLDVADLNNEAPWDRYGEGPNGLKFTLRHHVSSTFNQFWSTDRRADGFDVDSPQVLAALYQSTIVYGVFYDPLGNNAPITRPADGVLEGYSFNTQTVFWSVAAVRLPNDSSQSSLFLWDDPGTNLLKVAGSAPNVNFVAVDSNRRPLGDHFLWMYHPTHGSVVGKEYQVELAQGSDQLTFNGLQTVHMNATDVVVVRDAFISAGQGASFLAFPSAGLDVEIFLLRSDPNDAATWVRARSEAAASANVNGPGGPEQLFFTAPESAFFGYVIVNKSGTAGDVTLQRFG
jgi:hypothetical protein